MSCSLRTVLAKINEKHGGGRKWMTSMAESITANSTRDFFVDFIFKYDFLTEGPVFYNVKKQNLTF